MVEQIYSENIRKINRNKNVLEESFKVKFSFKSGIVFIEGKAEDEFLALQAIEAINLGFSIGEVLLLKNEDFAFEKINIKSITKRKNLAQVRARVIGVKGKALRVIEELSDCYISLHDSTVGIIGYLSDVKKAAYALERLIAGSKHASMYGYLEKQKALEKQSF